MIRHCWPMVAMLLFGITPAPSRAAYELVLNGGFDTGTFAGWTLSGPETFVALDYGLFGGYGVKYGAVGVDALLYQTITTVPGASYTFSFWQQTRGPDPNEFQAYWNGDLLLDRIDTPPDSVFNQYVFNVVAITSATQIRFGLRQDFGYSAMDQVSVQLTGTVPEPSSLLMVGTVIVLGGAGVAARCRAERGPRPAS